MRSADWLKVPGYGQRGVDILSDLSALEEERDLYLEFYDATYQDDSYSERVKNAARSVRAYRERSKGK